MLDQGVEDLKSSLLVVDVRKVDADDVLVVRVRDVYRSVIRGQSRE